MMTPVIVLRQNPWKMVGKCRIFIVYNNIEKDDGLLVLTKKFGMDRN